MVECSAGLMGFWMTWTVGASERESDGRMGFDDAGVVCGGGAE